MTYVKPIKWCCIGHILIRLYNSYKQILGNRLMAASWVYMKPNCNRPVTHTHTHTHTHKHTRTSYYRTVCRRCIDLLSIQAQSVSQT